MYDIIKQIIKLSFFFVISSINKFKSREFLEKEGRIQPTKTKLINTCTPLTLLISISNIYLLIMRQAYMPYKLVYVLIIVGVSKSRSRYPDTTEDKPSMSYPISNICLLPFVILVALHPRIVFRKE